METCIFNETGEGSAKGHRCQVTVDVLPDVVLLKIFDCYLNQAREEHNDLEIEVWHTLVHVCQKWRFVVFGSPRRLNLRLLCTERTPVREMLGVWPPLPIVVRKSGASAMSVWDMDIIMLVAALEHYDRVCEISLWDVTSSEWVELLAPMQKPYLALTNLTISWGDDDVAPRPIVPESFLGGSAPRLRHLTLDYMSFPGLPKLLLSATHLVVLHLRHIPKSGYFTPEAIVTGLSTSTSLESLVLEFKSPLSRSNRESQRPPPLTRSILPALTTFRFEGAGEYLEDVVARIDTPLLDDLEIKLYHQPIFNSPQLTQFISRTPNLETQSVARVILSGDQIWVLPRIFPRGLKLVISCRQSDWLLLSVAQFYSSAIRSLPQTLIHTVENLYTLDSIYPRPHWQDGIEDGQWLEVLHPYTGVKNLFSSRESMRSIAPALQELVGERVLEVLPALQGLFLEELHLPGPVQEAIGKFVAARQLAGHPIIVSHWSGESVEDDD